MACFKDTYKNKSVLVTGHTGFKGSWLSLWLKELGAHVTTGLALEPHTSPNHISLLNNDIDQAPYCDIRDYNKVADTIKRTRPEIVFHLAAQALVRHSYHDPAETWSTNVQGTVNILDACRHTPSVKAIVVITTDKCYENKEWLWGYRENDPLGGHDPYSASKAATELVVSSFRQSFFSHDDAPLLASARAGNVIGGGDWSEDRLIPDLVRSVQNREPLMIRSPQATRPWQHVLDPLSGYLLLGHHLLQGRRDCATGFNFGPDLDANRTVQDVLLMMREFWPEINWQIDNNTQPHEATLLHLDSTKARQLLGWRPKWDIRECLQKTSEWYRSFYKDNQVLTKKQIEDYTSSLMSEEIAI